MCIRILRSLVLMATLSSMSPVALQAEDVLLLPYFDANGQNGVYLSWSADGRTFHAVNNGKPVFTPPQWPGQNLTRDPSIVYHDGQFHMVWTSNWSGNIMGHSSSQDLVSWSSPQQIQPFPDGSEQPNNVWAPDIFRDPIADNFKIVWSSTLNSELNDGDGSADPHGNDHRMYYIGTTDFESFSEPELLFQDEGYSVIDAHVVFDDNETRTTSDDRWVMSLKKEQGIPQGGKNIRLAFSDPTIEPSSFSQTTPPVVGPGSPIRPGEVAEGSSIVRWNDQWLMYWDAYGNGRYSMASSPDLENWTDETHNLEFPVAHPRHGTVFVVDADNIGWDLTIPTDLNADGIVDGDDWQVFVANNYVDLSGYSSQEQARRGDLDGDGDNDFDDYRLFQQQYDSLHGPGALAQLVTRQVAEPAGVVPAIGGALLFLVGRRDQSATSER